MPLEGIAVDATGKLYVANPGEFSHVSDSISVFDTVHGNAPLPILPGNNMRLPERLAVR